MTTRYAFNAWIALITYDTTYAPRFLVGNSVTVGLIVSAALTLTLALLLQRRDAKKKINPNWQEQVSTRLSLAHGCIVWLGSPWSTAVCKFQIVSWPLHPHQQVQSRGITKRVIPGVASDDNDFFSLSSRFRSLLFARTQVIPQFRSHLLPRRSKLCHTDVPVV